MKPDNGNESISISNKVNDSVDDPDTILQTCSTLKTLVDHLLNQVNGRVVHLENEATEVKAVVRHLEHRHDRDEIIHDHTFIQRHSYQKPQTEWKQAYHKLILQANS